MRRALPHLAAAGCFALLAAAVLGPVLAGRAAVAPQNLMAFDPLYRTDSQVPPPVYADHVMVAADVPRDSTVAAALGAGHFPLWNPLSGCGAPLWAEQGGPFTPLKLPFYIAPSPRGYAFFLCLRLIVAGCGAYALARYRGLAWLPAVAAGAGFELSGAMIEQVPFGNFSATPLLPWAVLGAETIARRGSGRAVAGAALALGLAGHGGHPTVSALVFVGFAAALGGHVLGHLRRPRAAAATAARGAVAVALGVALAAPALLPLAELRGEASSYKDRQEGAHAWAVELAKTRATAPIALLAPWVLRIMYEPIGPEHEAAGALGVTAAVLVGAGLLGGGLNAGLAALALVGAVLTLVPPGFGWVHALPGLRLILPEYAWPLMTLPLTQALGRGLSALPSTAGVRAMSWSLIGFATALAGLVVRGPGSFPVLLWSPFTTSLAEHFAEVLAKPSGRAALLVPPALTALALAVCALLRRAAHAAPSPVRERDGVRAIKWRRIRPIALTPSLSLAGEGARTAGWVQLGVAALAIGELVVLWRPTLQHPWVGATEAEPPPAVAFLQQRLKDPRWRMTAMPLVGQPLTPMRFGLADVRGLSALPITRFRNYLGIIDPQGNPMTYQQVTPQRSPLYDLAATRYVVVWRLPGRPLDAHLDDDADLALVFSTPYAAVYENRAALPRARIAHRSEPVADAAAARARLAELSHGAGHARDTPLATTVIVEPDAAGVAPPVLDGLGSEAEWVRIADASDPDALELEAQLDSPGLVVVADTYYPGWQAAVDGVPVPIFPANALFRAVHVPAGRHAIAMRYRPASLRWGLLSCALALLVCALLAVHAERRARPPS